MNLRLLFLMVLLIGIGFFSFSLTQNQYKDEKKGAELFIKSYEISKSEYNKIDTELRTSKNTFMDLGSGVIIFSSTVLIFLFYRKIKTHSDLKSLKSLSKKEIFIWANLFWLILIPGTYFYYLLRLSRGDYAPFSDSIGIPISFQTDAVLYLIIPLNIFLFIAIYKSHFPNNIFLRFNFKTFNCSFWEIIFCLLLILNQLILLLLIIDGDHFMIITNLVFTFILLSLRTGKIDQPDGLLL